MEEADAFLTLQAQAAPKIALGVSLCILSPMLLIYLGALSDVEGGYRVSEAVAMAVGLPVLLLVVVGAAALFLRYGRPLERYDYLDKEAIELAYGVEGVVRKRYGAMVKRHTTRLIAGTALCILAAVPLFVSAVFEEQGALMGPVYGLLATLAMVAVGVYLLVGNLHSKRWLSASFGGRGLHPCQERRKQAQWPAVDDFLGRDHRDLSFLELLDG